MSDKHGVQEHSVDITDPRYGTWVRIRSGGEGFLGRVHQLEELNAYLTPLLPIAEAPDEEGSLRTEVPVREILRAKLLTLMPCYDFAITHIRMPITDARGRPVVENGQQKMGMSREPIVAGCDFNLHPVPMHFRSWDNLYVFSQAHKDDLENLRQFVTHAEMHMKEFRAQISNLAVDPETARKVIALHEHKHE
jgi:hypothetical protein